MSAAWPGLNFSDPPPSNNDGEKRRKNVDGSKIWPTFYDLKKVPRDNILGHL